MKKTIFILSVFIILYSCSKENNEEPEVIYDGSIWFKTQEQVDDFGKEGYTKILGNVIIDDNEIDPNSLITNLNSLSTLKLIDGNLGISKTTELTNLDGLNNLFYIKYLSIVGNDKLLNIDGLKNVSSDLEALYIRENYSLENIDGLKNISGVNNGIRLIVNPKLKNIDGLMNLKNVKGEIQIIISNIINLNALINLSSPIESLTITQNPRLKSLSGLDNIPSVENGLFVNNNETLSDLCGVKTIVKQIIDFSNKEENMDLFPIPFGIGNNAYNPTKQDYIDGNCKN